MERVEPAVLLTALPAIPVGLIVLKMFRWEDSLLQFLRKCSSSVPLLKTVLPSTVLVYFLYLFLFFLFVI